MKIPIKTYQIDGKRYKNFKFVIDGDLAVCVQAGLQIGGYEAELLGDTVRGRDGWRIVFIEKDKVCEKE